MLQTGIDWHETNPATATSCRLDSGATNDLVPRYDGGLSSLLTLRIRNGKTLPIGMAQVVALARLLMAILTSVIDDNTHLVGGRFQIARVEGKLQ